MTLVLTAKGLIWGVLTFKNRGHLGSRHIHTTFVSKCMFNMIQPHLTKIIKHGKVLPLFERSGNFSMTPHVPSTPGSSAPIFDHFSQAHTIHVCYIYLHLP